jgi:quinoprotein dehydrogenase-associated probable ABC transporter substrate-binding protein
MTTVATLRRAALCIAGTVLAAMPLAATPQAALAQAGNDPALSIELVDPKVFRVCADPHNMPFSNQGGEGFENKVAELFANKLGKSLAYTWFPQSVGFIRNTLNAHKCDVIMGFPQGGELAQSTNPYYRTAYAIVFKPGSGLDGIETLTDPRLKGKKIGVVAGTPPATYLAMQGLLTTVKGYPLVIDTRVDSSAEAMMKDLAAGEIETGVLWGPMAGYYAKLAGDVKVVPLVKDSGGPRLAYRMTMGVRAADQEWKRQLNGMIREQQGEINRIMLGYGVPLLDERDQPIPQQPMK